MSIKNNDQELMEMANEAEAFKYEEMKRELDAEDYEIRIAKHKTTEAVKPPEAPDWCEFGEHSAWQAGWASGYEAGLKRATKP